MHFRKTTLRVGAEHAEFFRLTVPDPEVFKVYGGPAMALSPQDGDHLSESPDRPIAFSRAQEQIGQQTIKEIFIRPTVDHEVGQHLFDVQLYVLILERKGEQVPTRCLQSLVQRSQMFGRGDDHHGVAHVQTGGNQLFQNIEKPPVIL